MANRPRTLDPQASPAALFGAELRSMRTRCGMSLARLGQLVHVSGDLLGKTRRLIGDHRPTSSAGWIASWKPRGDCNGSATNSATTNRCATTPTLWCRRRSRCQSSVG